jgi:hypothetical protein
MDTLVQHLFKVRELAHGATRHASSERTLKQRPRIRLTIRQRMRVLDSGRGRQRRRRLRWRDFKDEPRARVARVGVQ